jgi:HSP20 family protein
MLPMLHNRFELVGPFAVLTNLRREVDRVFDEAWTGQPPRRPDDERMEGRIDWVPAVEVLEAGDEIRCLVEVPGLAPEDVNISIDDGVLTVEGERKLQRKEQNDAGTGGTYHLLERRYGRFVRRFTLPREVDADRITAQTDRGVLTIVLPKTAAAKPRRIAIKANEGSAQSVRNGQIGTNVQNGQSRVEGASAQQQLGETGAKDRGRRQVAQTA